MIPKTNHELIKFGNQLNICVGNGKYAKKIKKKSSYVVFYTYKKYTYCVELNRNQILQIKEKNNISPKKDIKKQIQSLFCPFIMI